MIFSRQIGVLESDHFHADTVSMLLVYHRVTYINALVDFRFEMIQYL